MRRIAIVWAGLTLFCISGCTWYDAMFGAFGKHYTNGTGSEDR